MANKKVSQLTSKPSVLTTDLFPIADPSTGQLFKTTISDLGTAIGSGVSSVNTLVGAVVLDTDDIQELASPTNKWFTDTRARAALSASSPLTYNSGTGAFGIQVATGSQNGYLSSADWTTFNAKQAALSGTGFVKISGTTISYDNSTYLTTSAAASTYLALAGGTLTGALNGTSATFTGDLTISSTNPRIYLTDTDNNPDYFISNTDGTFTVYDVTNSTSRLTISTLNTILNTNLRVDGDILIKQDSVLGGVSGYTAIASDTDGIFLKLGTASAHAYLVLSGLTSYRNFTLPDATGTFALTSDLSAYLLKTGGTLTGALSGTSATFSGDVTIANPSNNNKLFINRASSAYTSGIFYQTNGTSDFLLGQNPLSTGTSDLSIYNYGTSSVVFNIARSTGAATFSSSVTATNLYLGSSNPKTASDGRILQVGNNGIIENVAGTQMMIANNAYYNGSGWFYLNTANAQAIRFGSTVAGDISFHSAPSGTSGASITNWDSSDIKMYITPSGNVGIGTTSPNDYSGYNTLHINGKSGANGGVLRLTAYDSTSSANIYAGASALNINTTSAVPIKFLTRDTTRMQILDNGSIIAGNLIGNQYSMTSGAGTGTAIVDTGITYNSGDYGGYGRGVTYEVVFNGNPNGNGSAAYFAQYMGILILYTGWSGSAVTTYIQFTQLAGGNNIGALTLTPVFWNGSTESSSIGVYTTGAQIRLKISGYNSGATGQDQSVYLRRIS